MFAVKPGPLLAALCALATQFPAMAVGLGPMKAEGVSLTARKGFYLTVINPYETPQFFRLDALSWVGEQQEPHIDILPASALLGPGQRRRVLVIFNDIEQGAERQARICARLDRPRKGVAIDARVCSKLTARRMP